MAYDLNQFIADCRNSLKRDPGPNGREQVRANLERLLQNKEFVEKYCGEEVAARTEGPVRGPGARDSRCLRTSTTRRAFRRRTTTATSWAIYGQASLWTDMIEWKREDDGKDPKHAKLEPAKKYRLNPGHAGIYQDGKIHSIDYPDKSRFVRVTGVNLDKINRIRIDLKTGEVHQMTPQQAT